MEKNFQNSHVLPQKSGVQTAGLGEHKQLSFQNLVKLLTSNVKREKSLRVLASQPWQCPCASLPLHHPLLLLPWMSLFFENTVYLEDTEADQLCVL